MNPKTLKKLEYDAVLAQLANFAQSSLAKQAVLQLTPAATFSDAQVLLDETREAMEYYDLGISPDFALDDAEEILRRAKVGSTLSAGELLCVMRLLRTSRNLFSSLGKALPDSPTQILSSRANLLYFDKRLEDDVEFAIISPDEINDRASDDLYEIRQRIKRINADIKEKLSNYTKKGELSQYLQDTIVTIRNDRYVIPVKAEYRSLVSGIVHDTSGSGSTFFIEPMAIVELNNKLRRAAIEEKEEIERILQAFTDRIRPVSERLFDSQKTIVYVDTVFAKVKYGVDCGGKFPELTSNGKIFLKNARHPLLDRKKAVPITVALTNATVLVITGPNTGGKTVTLKTVGLTCLMAASGMMTTCGEGSAVSFFDEVFCDIGDEQSIRQNLSTFSSHIVNICNILGSCNDRSLVLIDEIGAGTEPNEGAALALAITDFLRKSGAKCLITTHFGQLKEYSLVTDGVENASMEFNPETYEPTYKLIMGVPGSSNAIAIARKLGLRSDVADAAERNVSSDHVSFENVLQNAEELRRSYEHQLAELENDRKKLAAEMAKTERLNGSLSLEREKLLSSSRAEAKRIVAQAKEESKQLIDKIKDILSGEELQDKSLFEARKISRQFDELKLDGEAEEESDYVFYGDKVKFSDLKVGFTAYSEKLKVAATVVEVKNPEKVVIRAGNLTATVPASDLHYYGGKSEKRRLAKTAREATTQVKSRQFSNEINLLGQTVAEAIANVDEFIDEAVLNGLSQVWIIHGMGTGRLRQGLHEHLKKHPNVESFRLGKYGEGESGVTVVTLK